MPVYCSEQKNHTTAYPLVAGDRARKVIMLRDDSENMRVYDFDFVDFHMFHCIYRIQKSRDDLSLLSYTPNFRSLCENASPTLMVYITPSDCDKQSHSHLLSVPRHNLSFGARAFRVAAPKIWNSIPLHTRQSQTYSSFRRHLKTYYFLSACPLAAM